MKRISFIAILVVDLGAVLIAAAELFGKNLGLSERQLLALLVLAVGLTTTNFAVAEFFRSSTRDELRDVAADLFGPLCAIGSCRVTSDEIFFATLRDQVKRAKTAVDLTNLDSRPPRQLPFSAEKDYFGNLRRLIRSTDATVRRVERFTPHKREWISHLVQEFQNCHNASLAVYPDRAGDADMPLAVSVQRIDDAHAWLVALAEHRSQGFEARDVYVNESHAVQLIAQYYNRLWSSSIQVVRDGELDESAWERAQRSLD